MHLVPFRDASDGNTRIVVTPVVPPQAWPQDWERDGITVKVIGPKTHKSLDVFCHQPSFFFHFLLNFFVNEGRKKMFFLAECYHNKKLISTNCSKITQKLSPCAAPGELLFSSIASACLGFSCSSRNLRPLVLRVAC